MDLSVVVAWVSVLGTFALVAIPFVIDSRRRSLLYRISERTALLPSGPSIPELTALFHDGRKLDNPFRVKIELVSRSSKDIAREDFDGQEPLVLNVNVPIEEILNIEAPAGFDRSHVTYDGTMLKIGPLLIQGRQRITITLLVNEGQQSTLERVSGNVVNVDLKPRITGHERSLRSRMAKVLPWTEHASRRTLVSSTLALLGGTALTVYLFSLSGAKTPSAGQPHDPSSSTQVQATGRPSTTTPSPSLSSSQASYTTGAVLKATAAVSSLAFSPDGRTLATGGGDEAVVLWDATGHQKIKTLLGHTAAITSIAFSPDGRTVAAGSDDDTVLVWNVAGGQPTRTLTGTGKIDAVAFSPDGTTLAAGTDDNNVMLWQVGTGRSIATLTGHTNSVNALAFSPDGRTLATGSGDNAVILWNTGSRQGTRTRTDHTDGVTSVAFSPNGKIVAAGSYDNNIILWDAATGNEISHYTSDETVNGIAFSPDGKTLASAGADKTVSLWDVDSGRQITMLTGFTDEVTSVAFSPTGRTLVAGSNDRTIRFWTFG